MFTPATSESIVLLTGIHNAIIDAYGRPDLDKIGFLLIRLVDRANRLLPSCAITTSIIKTNANR